MHRAIAAFTGDRRYGGLSDAQQIDNFTLIADDLMRVRQYNEVLRGHLGDVTTTKLGLKYGSIHVDVPKQSGPTDFSVSTPVATLSIRGTAGDIDFFSDTGLHLFSERGTWHIANGLLYLDVGPGQGTTGTFTPHLDLVVLDRSTFPGDFFSGTDTSERHFVLTTASGGRGEPGRPAPRGWRRECDGGGTEGTRPRPP